MNPFYQPQAQFATESVAEVLLEYFPAPGVIHVVSRHTFDKLMPRYLL